MPIKYNLTKYDLLAEKYHELSQKKDQFTQDEENIRAQAILIASFSSSHSWNTNRLIMEGNPNLFLNSTDMIIAEHILSKASKWKQVKNTDIQEVARININGIFPHLAQFHKGRPADQRNLQKRMEEPQRGGIFSRMRRKYGSNTEFTLLI